METQKEPSSSSLLSYFSSPFKLGSFFPLRALRSLLMMFTSSASSTAPPPTAYGLRQLPWLWSPGAKLKTDAEVNEVQIRRDLALKPTVEDPDTERRVVPFVNSRGQTIFTQSWTPAAPDHSIKGLLVLIHGLNEHSGRYAEFAIQLNSQGYGVFGMDWIGHGGSDGLHGYVQALDHVVSDVKEYYRRVAAEYPGIPCFLFGHSTGGAIALKVASQPDMEKELQGVVVSSVAVKVKPAHPVIGAVAPLFSVLLPRYQFRGANRRLAVCRDPAALVAKYTDPLVYTGPIRIRTGTEILRLSSYLLRRLTNVSIPLLVLHGSDDQVTDPKGSQELYDQASTKHKNIILYDGNYNCPYLEERSNQGKVHPLCKEQRMILWKLPMPLPFITRKHNQRSVKSCHKNCFSPLEDGRLQRLAMGAAKPESRC
ncbi:unnamed protein product [Sphagnum troendelagicum]|uniref:Serine aminopeptidase S33 domain-containing protein n=1 Tax=Sphagnum troendelagicum TaxID=128251 RepID=A0ABP0UFF6_9BRYO